MTAILAIGAIQSLFFSLLLINKKKKSLPDKILDIWLFILFLHISANYLEYTGYYIKFPHLIGSTSSFIFLYGPLLYFYVKAYISNSFGFKVKYLFHLLPFLLYNMVVVPFYLQSAQNKLYYYDILKTDPPLIASLALVIKAISIPVYLIWTLYLLKWHRKNIKQYFAHAENIDLKWLKYLVWSIALVGMVVLFTTTLKVQTLFTVVIETEIIIFSAASLWILGLGYYGLKQTPIFTNAVLPQSKEITNPKTSTVANRYEKTKLKEPYAKRYQKRLLDYMENEQPFIKNKLTLDELAMGINIPPHHLSQVLNEKLNQNFFDFINSYRVREIKKKIQDPKNKHLTLLGIALNAGFNSKASFNRIFKKHTGLTPSDYLKNN